MPPHIFFGVVDLRGVTIPIRDRRVTYNHERANYAGLPAVTALNMGAQVVGMLVRGVSDVITLMPEKLRPMPELSSAVSNDHRLAIGSVRERTPNPLNIEQLMISAEMGLVSKTLP